MKYNKKFLQITEILKTRNSNENFLSRHPELETFDMPKTFYFRYLPDRNAIHWAIIVPLNNTCHTPATVYFINDWGRVFDKLEFKSIKIARRRLRKNGFDFSTNRYCPFTPPEPIYIQLSDGKKSAPYSKGNLWQSVQRSRKHSGKLEKTYYKQRRDWYRTIAECYEYNKQHAEQTSQNQTEPSIFEALYLILAGIIMLLLGMSATAWFFD